MLNSAPLRATLGALAATLLLAACAPAAPASSTPGSAAGTAAPSSAATPTGGGVPAAQAPKLVRFMAGYKPQANLPFVGVYIAQELGYFQQEGIQVQLTHDPGDGSHLKLIAQGAIDVTTDPGDTILGRRADQGVPLVSIAVLGQRSQDAYAVLASSDIHSPKDWEGHTVGYKITPTPDYLALLAAAHVDRSRIQEVPVGFDPRLLVAKKVDVYPVYESNEPDTLKQMGVPIRLFRPVDYGVPGLGLTYLTTDQVLQQHPDRLERFLKATLHGIDFARAHPEQATDIVMHYAPQENRAHQLAMLKVELDMANGPSTGAHGIGWTTTAQWQALEDSLLKYGGMHHTVDVQKAFTNRLLSQIYNGPTLIWP